MRRGIIIMVLMLDLGARNDILRVALSSGREGCVCGDASEIFNTLILTGIAPD